MVLVDKLDMSQQCAFVTVKASCILDCVSENTVSRLRRGCPLLSTCVAASGRLQFLAFQCKRTRLELVQHRAMKMVKGLEHMACEQRLREMGLFSLEKSRFRWDLIAHSSYLLGVYREKRTSLFLEVHSKRTWVNRYKWQ